MGRVLCALGGDARTRRPHLRRRGSRGSPRLDLGLAPERQHMAPAPALPSSPPQRQVPGGLRSTPRLERSPRRGARRRVPRVAPHRTALGSSDSRSATRYVPATLNNYVGEFPGYVFSDSYEDVWKPELRRLVLVRLNAVLERAPAGRDPAGYVARDRHQGGERITRRGPRDVDLPSLADALPATRRP